MNGTANKKANQELIADAAHGNRRAAMRWNNDTQSFEMTPKAEAIFCAAALSFCPVVYAVVKVIAYLVD
jgi:hypothetical protein